LYISTNVYLFAYLLGRRVGIAFITGLGSLVCIVVGSSPVSAGIDEGVIPKTSGGNVVIVGITDGARVVIT
jgi:hypothetical protein